MNKIVSKLFFVLLLLGTLVGFQGNTVDAKKDMPIDDLSITGKYAIIMDMDTEEILYRKNANTKCENASTTKLLTAIVAVENNSSLSKKIKISAKASNTMAVKIYMNRGDWYSLNDLLHATLIRSANDCAVAIAEGTSGSVKQFMKDMNQRAKEIGCKNTHFGTPNGLYTTKTHHTTASDLAKITKYAYNNATIRKIMKKKKYTFKSKKGKVHKVESTNLLLKNEKYYCVGKTGSGTVAKYCFAGVFTYEGRSFVLITLGNKMEKGRWKDTKKMIRACKKYAREVGY